MCIVCVCARVFVDLRPKVESSRDAWRISAWHAAADLLAELANVTAGSV